MSIALNKGVTRGYHCHLLIIYNGSLHRNDGYLGQEIGELWQEKITNGEGEFYNCNQSKHKQRYKQEGTLGIGMIPREDQKKVIMHRRLSVIWPDLKRMISI